MGCWRSIRKVLVEFKGRDRCSGDGRKAGDKGGRRRSHNRTFTLKPKEDDRLVDSARHVRV